MFSEWSEWVPCDEIDGEIERSHAFPTGAVMFREWDEENEAYRYSKAILGIYDDLDYLAE